MLGFFFKMSLTINKNTTNKLVFTAYEYGVLVNPYYLFEFIKDDTNTPVYWVGTDISNYKVRANICVFNEPVNLLLQPGFYKYNVYEQAGSSNLNPTGLTKVDFGILRVNDLSAVKPVEYAGADLTNVSYNG